jgi:2-isopropylmalate synthase
METPGQMRPSGDDTGPDWDRSGATSGWDDELEFVFSDEELREAEAIFDEACAEYAAGDYEMELKVLKAHGPEILRTIKAGVARIEAEKVRSRRERNVPGHVVEPDPPPKGEVERDCRLESDKVTRQLIALRKGGRRKAVRISDSTLRDGISSRQGVLSLEEKVWLARQIKSLNVDIIEVGAAWEADDLKVIGRVAKELGRSVTVCGLVRCDPEWKETRRVVDELRDTFDRAGTFTRRSDGEGADFPPRIHFFIETSADLRKKTSKLEDERVVELASRCVGYAREVGFVDIQLSAMDATRAEFALVRDVFRAVIDRGATTLNLADTAGWATPTSLGRLVRRLRAELPEVKDGCVLLSVHCHNSLGMATANSVAACEAGARQVEVTINGIGPRGGNAALEEVVMALKVRHALMGLNPGAREAPPVEQGEEGLSPGKPQKPGVQLKLLTQISQLVALKTGLPVSMNKPIVGRNAATEVHGVDVRSENVQLYDPEIVGASRVRVLGAHFGRQDLEDWLKSEKLTVPPHINLYDLYKNLRNLARTKQVDRDDVIALLADPDPEKNRHAFAWELVGVTATTTGQDCPSVASVKLRRVRDGRVIDEAATGTGPIRAVFTAIDRATGVLARLLSYRVRSTAAATSAQAEVILELGDELDEDMVPYQGRACSLDSVFASAKAYIDAINLISRERARLRPTPVRSQRAPDLHRRPEAATDDVDDRGWDDHIVRFPTARRDHA